MCRKSSSITLWSVSGLTSKATPICRRHQHRPSLSMSLTWPLDTLSSITAKSITTTGRRRWRRRFTIFRRKFRLTLRRQGTTAR